MIVICSQTLILTIDMHFDALCLLECCHFCHFCSIVNASLGQLEMSQKLSLISPKTSSFL